MLKGWTLTDVHCQRCGTTPLMREPAREASAAGRSEASRIEFCVRCDNGGPGLRHDSAPASISTPMGVNGMVNGFDGHNASETDESGSAIGSDLEKELESYVPPSMSSTVAVPVAPREQGSQNDQAEERRRQSDQASDKIGSLLLQGYSLLSTLCPSPGCYAIPLVGHPRNRGARNNGNSPPKKECVMCGKVWEADGTIVRDGRVSAQPAATVDPTQSVSSVDSSRQLISASSGVDPEPALPPSSGVTVRDIPRDQAIKYFTGELPVSAATQSATDQAWKPYSGTLPRQGASSHDSVAPNDSSKQLQSRSPAIPLKGSHKRPRRSSLDTEPLPDVVNQSHHFAQTVRSTNATLLRTLARLEQACASKLDSDEFDAFVADQRLLAYTRGIKNVLECLAVSKDLV